MVLVLHLCVFFVSRICRAPESREGSVVEKSTQTKFRMGLLSSSKQDPSLRFAPSLFSETDQTSHHYLFFSLSLCELTLIVRAVSFFFFMFFVDSSLRTVELITAQRNIGETSIQIEAFHMA